MSKVMGQELQDGEGRDKGRRDFKGRKEKGPNTRVQRAIEERAEWEKVWEKDVMSKFCLSF